MPRPKKRPASSAPAPDAPEKRGLPALAPDVVEQEKGSEIDNQAPTDGFAKLPVVGLGGSAGGLAALQAFFGAMRPDCGMAFVVIMHLSPEHESILAEVLQRTTTMPVRQVRDRTKVEANHVYVIPPAKHLSMQDGHLCLSEVARGRASKHVAVDLFFRTLADTHGARSAAIVLSGADGDGAIGIKRIKERGGLTVAQDPNEAEHDSMPRATIATGMVDWVLPAAEMPAKLCDYWRTEERLRLPAEEGPLPALQEARPPAAGVQTVAGEAALHDILGFLRARTGRDFTYYKRATILRRVARRMQVNGIETTPAYLAFLRTHAGETGALLQDLLISVTNFFRDREAFMALDTLIPSLFHGKGPNDTVRVWCAACATGEEAYSVAMLLFEHAGTLDHPPKIQVFATDLDENVIAQAREGTYPETISADVSEERLRRFFTRGHGNYLVKREVRETVLFALHDLLKDSPFSRLDMVTCRNLLIYLNRDAQERALDIFHFALQPEGVLFLGSSESVDDAAALFAVTDKKHRLFARRAVTRPRLPTIFTGPSTQTQVLLPYHKVGPVRPKAVPAQKRPGATMVPDPADPAGEDQASWSEVHSQMVEEFGPPSVIVNREHELVHLFGDAGRLLHFGKGEPTTNILRLVHPMLRIELRAALFRASQSGVVVETLGVPVETEGGRRLVDLRVAPTLRQAPGFLLVIFSEREGTATTQPSHTVGGENAEPAIQELERELEHAKSTLRDTVEQSDASQEELKASNEELQAMNEELRSTSEELETGREELQSINEELTTVNAEMKSKVEELGRANGDLQNLMAATQIATVFLDRQLCIKRYTPPAVALFNLIPTDVGRPLSDLTNRLNYPDLAADADRVLETVAVIEREVFLPDGQYFLARMRPYRTEEDRIAGVVLTFVDISERKKGEEALLASEIRFRAVADLVPNLLWSNGPDGVINWFNRRWYEYTGQTPAVLSDRSGFDAVPEAERAGAQQRFQDAVKRGESYQDEFRLRGVDGQERWHLIRAEPLREPDGRISQWFGTCTDVEDFKRAVADLTASQERQRLIIENASEYAIFTTDLEGHITSWNQGAARILGYSEAEVLGQKFAVIFTAEDQAADKPGKEEQTALALGRAADERWHQRKDGSRFWANGALMAMRNTQGQAIGFVKILRDETAARQTRHILEQSREDLAAALAEAERARAQAETAIQAKDHFLAVLSHELRTPLTPVLMAASILSQNPRLPASAREALEMIERNVKIESHFIDDLLDLTKITRGKLEIVREPMDLHDAVNHAVEISSADLEGKGQQLTVSLDAAAHKLSGDATRLQQVFWNLLKNASKFTPEGGSIRIVSRNEPGWIIVEVSDTGIGFAPGTESRIFEAFTQASRDVTRKFGGLGLGLAISKATMDAHGGTLRARSAGQNQGATFTVELPLTE